MEEDIKEILIALDNTTKKQLDKAIENADKEWSEMELEEDKKILEEFIKNCKAEDPFTIYFKEECIAIQNLIARYKELEEENERLKYSCAKATEIIDEYTNETEMDTEKLIEYQEKYLNNK